MGKPDETLNPGERPEEGGEAAEIGMHPLPPSPEGLAKVETFPTGLDIPSETLEDVILRVGERAASAIDDYKMVALRLKDALERDLISVTRFNKYRRAFPARIFLRSIKLAGKDLRGIDLSDADLQNADLTGADIRGAILTRSDLKEADLRGCLVDEHTNFEAALLDKTDLRKINGLESSDLLRAVFHRAIIRPPEIFKEIQRIIAANSKIRAPGEEDAGGN